VPAGSEGLLRTTHHRQNLCQIAAPACMFNCLISWTPSRSVTNEFFRRSKGPPSMPAWQAWYTQSGVQRSSLPTLTCSAETCNHHKPRRLGFKRTLFKESSRPDVTEQASRLRDRFVFTPQTHHRPRYSEVGTCLLLEAHGCQDGVSALSRCCNRCCVEISALCS
jgi:hypothetical protein